MRAPDHRLRSLIIFDTALAGAGGSTAIIVSLTIAQVTSLFWVGVFVVASAACMASALLPLQREDVNAAVLRISIANWVVAVGTSVVATFAWPLLMQAALLPSVLAASFVSRQKLRVYVAVSLVASTAVAGFGLLQDVTDLSAQVPNWVRTMMLLGTGPPLGALVVLVALQHNLNLRLALDDEQHARLTLAEQADELRRSRLRVVAATDRERQRIERDLHDGAQSRLVAVNLGLARLRAAITDDPDAVPKVLDGIRHEVQLAHSELRDLAHGLYPTVLTQHGIEAAIGVAADRSAIPVTLDVSNVGRHHPDVEAAIYFCVLEAIHNASRHSRGSAIAIRLQRSVDAVTFEVADDGIGIDPTAMVGHGLVNMKDRLGAIGGTLDVLTNGGQGTKVVGVVRSSGSLDL